MRLWHKDLIPVLPRQQLLGQWRECCCIAKNIAELGMPNHLLVNKIMQYPIGHFFQYTFYVFHEMEKRGYHADYEKFLKWYDLIMDGKAVSPRPSYDDLFAGWHNDRYLTQCFYNLQEKYDCGGITGEEWAKIEKSWWNNW